MKKKSLILLGTCLLIGAITLMPTKTEAGVRYDKYKNIVQEDGTRENECLSSIFKQDFKRVENPE